MILFYDTETTGLPDFKARSNDETQPHLVQLALVLCNEDGAEAKSACVVIKPNGWIIPSEVTKIHGISHEKATEVGIPEDDAVALFVMMQAQAWLRVAHNESFDRRIMRIAMTRAGIERDFIEHIEGRTSHCTCNEAKPILDLPATDRMKTVGFNGPKPPKLEECIKHFFGEELPGSHDALVDARACARIFFHMKTIGAAA